MLSDHTSYYKPLHIATMYICCQIILAIRSLYTKQPCKYVVRSYQLLEAYSHSNHVHMLSDHTSYQKPIHITTMYICCQIILAIRSLYTQQPCTYVVRSYQLLEAYIHSNHACMLSDHTSYQKPLHIATMYICCQIILAIRSLYTQQPCMYGVSSYENEHKRQRHRHIHTTTINSTETNLQQSMHTDRDFNIVIIRK